MDETKNCLQNHLIETEKLYLNEKFLRCLKSVNKNADSKSIVDRATIKPLDQVLKALENLNENNLNEIEKFIETYLHEPGIEIVKAVYADWNEDPKFLNSIKNNELKEFAKSLNKIWQHLYKKLDLSKLGANCVSSHLPMKYPFIVPGGRFIEIYYWDTFWTLEGLLVCRMLKTAKEIIENFINFIKLYGFIPNGSRVYYLNRSQPPYFAQMVMRYYKFCMELEELKSEEKENIKKFVLNEALDAITKEYKYWIKTKTVTLKSNLNLNKEKCYKFQIYRANTKKPRPESYFEDINTASKCNSKKEKEKIYRHIASAAESGYDFTSRWFKDPIKMETIHTNELIPVDLNCILYKNELIISELNYLKGEKEIAKNFKNYSVIRKNSINELLWCKEKKCWVDLNFKTNEQKENFYLTNLAPLWFGIEPPDNVKEMDIINKYLRNSIENYCGVPYSLIKSGQQWDFPNIWAPNQYCLIEFIQNYDYDLALDLARKFFNTVYQGWLIDRSIFEKYNCFCLGERGHGGEYEVQSGFGWTNGVMFYLIDKFQDKLINDK